MMARRLLCSALLLLAAPALAGTVYVRTGGSDTKCNGTTPDAVDPLGGSNQSCAFATVKKGVTEAACGDTVDVGPGVFVDSTYVRLDDCPTAPGLTVKGAGKDKTVWAARTIAPSNCAPDPDRAHVYICDYDPGETTTSNWAESHWNNDHTVEYHDSRRRCVQNYDGLVPWADNNGVDGDMTGWVNMILHRQLDDLEATRGSYYFDKAAKKIYIHPYGDKDITDGESVLCPGEEVDSNGDPAIWLDGANQTIEDITLVSGTSQLIDASGSSSLTIERTDLFAGLTSFRNSASGITLRHVRFMNGYTAKYDEPSLTANESLSMTSQNVLFSGCTNVRAYYIEDYAAREGVGFSAGTHDVVIDGAKVHGHHNHNLKFIDSVHDITIKDAALWNAQEGSFIACAYDLEYDNVYFAQELIIQGNPGGCPNNEPKDIDVYNSILHRAVWHTYSGSRENGGYDFDYNLYVDEMSENDGVRSSDYAPGSDFGNDRRALWRFTGDYTTDCNGDGTADDPCDTSGWNDNYFTLDQIQSGQSASGSPDPCPDCTNDPHSHIATWWEDVVLNHTFKDDSASNPFDAHLTDSSPAKDIAWADKIEPDNTADLDGNTRHAPYDNGPYDEGSAGEGPVRYPVVIYGVTMSGVEIR